jgi:hypothetical protein
MIKYEHEVSFARHISTKATEDIEWMFQNRFTAIDCPSVTVTLVLAKPEKRRIRGEQTSTKTQEQV